jgi:hypothetical protein
MNNCFLKCFILPLVLWAGFYIAPYIGYLLWFGGLFIWFSLLCIDIADFSRRKTWKPNRLDK